MTEPKLQEVVIDFGKLGGPVFVGRTKGEKVRDQLGLDCLDENERGAKVLVPEDTFSINPSFFLALFGASIRKAGSREEFFNRFRFQAPKHIMETVERSVARALHEKHRLV